MQFRAVGIDSYGSLGYNARQALLAIGRYAAEVRGTNPSDEATFLIGRFCSHLYRLQSLAVNRRRHAFNLDSDNVAL